jgi:hypothetical protein
VFRRRRSADVGRDWDEDDGSDLYGDEVDYDESAGDERPAAVTRPEGGPWDAGEPCPARERVDLGSLHVPVGPEHEIQLVMADQHGAWVTVRHGESEMQVQAFAAARRGALWDDVRREIADEVRRAGGESEERPGSFGVELAARVPAEPGQPVTGDADQGDRPGGAPGGSGGVEPPRSSQRGGSPPCTEEAGGDGVRLVRFVGIDGPRWFLRALFTGPAAAGGEAASTLEDVLRDVVVVRGEHPVPPRDILELRLPPEARQAFEEQAAAAEENRFRTDLNPFERGPEFTETR